MIHRKKKKKRDFQPINSYLSKQNKSQKNNNSNQFKIIP